MSAAREQIALVDRIRFDRADGRCECEAQCGRSHRFGTHRRCPNAHGRPAIHGTDKTVSLDVRPLDGNPNNSAETNLIAMCQSCVKRHRDKLKAAAEKKAARAGTDDSLFDATELIPQGIGSHQL